MRRARNHPYPEPQRYRLRVYLRGDGGPERPSRARSGYARTDCVPPDQVGRSALHLAQALFASRCVEEGRRDGGVAVLNVETYLIRSRISGIGDAVSHDSKRS